MYHITGTIEGIADILFNAPPPIEEEKGSGKKHPSKMSIEELREDALKRLHVNGRGLFHPSMAFLNCLYAGSNRAGLKDGKRSLSGTLEATVFVEGELLFGVDKPDYIHETWGRVPPRTGAMVVIRRPALKAGWRLPFNLLIADDRISSASIREALDHAGLLVGLGGWRPQYGRFKVIEWESEA